LNGGQEEEEKWEGESMDHHLRGSLRRRNHQAAVPVWVMYGIREMEWLGFTVLV